MMNPRAEGVQILALLEQVRRDQHEWITRHSKLLHEPTIDRAPHSSHGLLRAEKLAAEKACETLAI